MRFAGFCGAVDSKVWEMVVVAVVSDPLRPVRRVCSNIGCGLRLPDDRERSEFGDARGGLDSVLSTNDSAAS